MKDLLLMIETSGTKCSVALAQEQGGIWQLVAELPGEGELALQPEMQHTALLLSLIKRILATAPAPHAEQQNDFQAEGFARLQAVAVSSGPGSYTALRAGLSSAKGLCLALDIPIFQVDTLRALAFSAQELQGVEPFGKTLVVLPARRDEVYFAVYDALGAELMAPAVAINDKKWQLELFDNDVSTVCSPDFTLLEGFGESLSASYDRSFQRLFSPLIASNLLYECRLRINENNSDDLSSVAPRYLRPPHITQARTRL